MLRKAMREMPTPKAVTVSATVAVRVECALAHPPSLLHYPVIRYEGMPY